MSKLSLSEKEKRPDSPDKTGKKDRTLITSILIGIVLCFTVFFFQPVELFLGNQREFFVSFGYIAVPMLLTAIVSSAVLSGLLFLIHRFSRKACAVTARFLLGFLLSFYIQNLFFNKYMSPLRDGDNTVRAGGAFYLIDFILMYVIIFLPVMLYAAAQKKPCGKLSVLSGNTAVTYAASLVFAMQLVGAGTSFIRTDLKKVDYSFSAYLSYEPLMELSADENIIVFLYDRMDGYWTDEMLERYPELYDELDGFTYYQNNIARYDSTFPSVTAMLTGKVCKNGKDTGFLSDAWEGDNVFSLLFKNGWDTEMIMDKPNTFNSLSDLEPFCGNIREINGSDVKINYLGKEGIIPTMTKFSFTRLLPYYLKDFVSTGLSSDFSNGFVKYNKADASPTAVGEESDMRFYDYIKNHDMTVSSGRKKFIFIHTNGMHNKNCEEVKALWHDGSKYESDNVSTGCGTMVIIQEYLRKLKEEGIYDNSTIIILGDHGKQENYAKELVVEEITGLMIKPAGAERAPLETDRYSEMSNEYFLPGVLEYAGLSHEEKGTSYEDVLRGNVPPSRNILIRENGYRLWNVTGDARDFNNWKSPDASE